MRGFGSVGTVYSTYVFVTLPIEHTVTVPIVYDLCTVGHCFEAGTGNPPRGLQLTLGSKSNPNYTDTIVMANLGYLQLKVIIIFGCISFICRDFGQRLKETT